ncbi:MAG: SGNH/GDSL hydrolase family protein [Phycisphaerae bacterium]
MALSARETDYRRITLLMLFILTAYLAAAGVTFRVLLGSIGGETEVLPAQATDIYYAMWFHGIAAIVGGLVGLKVRRLSRCGLRWPRIVLLASLLTLVVSLDRVVGIVFPPPSKHEPIVAPHPARGWYHRPGVAGTGSGVIVHINRFGMRGPDLPSKKADDEFRILFLGDSVTFGPLLEWKDTFVSRTEDKLHRLDPTLKLVAINAGVVGYNTWQELDLLKDEGMRVEPDLVVLTYCINDMTELIHLDQGEVVGNPIRFTYPNVPHWSGLVRAMRSIAQRRHARAVGEGVLWVNHDPFDGTDPRLRTEADFFRIPPLESVNKAWNLSFRYLDDVDRFCKQRGLPFVLMNGPLLHQIGSDETFDRPGKRLKQWAEQHSVIMVDLARAFEEEIRRSRCSSSDLLFDSIHPSARGSALIADEVVRALLKYKLLPVKSDGAD